MYGKYVPYQVRGFIIGYVSSVLTLVTLRLLILEVYEWYIASDGKTC